MLPDENRAFPMGYHPEGNSADHQGMSHRAYLAAHAPQDVLQTIMGHTAEDIAGFLGVAVYNDDLHYLLAYTKAAYVYADAMIVAAQHSTKGKL